MDLLENELPLFPLDLVLLPSCRVPLHIFEDRYKIMVGDCVDRDGEFVVVWGSDEVFRDVGCAARVADVINRYADGRMNIVVCGTRRVQILGSRDVHPFLSATVEPLCDDPAEPDADLGERTRKLYEEALRLTLGWFRPDPEEPVDPRVLAYNAVASLSLPLERQQEILETRSVNDRLSCVADLLEDALSSLRDASRRASGNGRAR